VTQKKHPEVVVVMQLTRYSKNMGRVTRPAKVFIRGPSPRTWCVTTRWGATT
jgi:hypothetical protein